LGWSLPTLVTLMHHDEMVLSVDRDLHIVADNIGTMSARRHRAGIGIAERDLLIGRDLHLRLDPLETLRVFLDFGELLLEMRGLRSERLPR
jgi:hypothetical protein